MHGARPAPHGLSPMRSSLICFVPAIVLASSTFLVPAWRSAGEPGAEHPKNGESERRPQGLRADAPPVVRRRAVGLAGRYAPSNGVKFAGDPGALLQGASPWGYGFVGQASAGYRFVPFMSAGLRGGFRSAVGLEPERRLARTSRAPAGMPAPTCASIRRGLRGERVEVRRPVDQHGRLVQHDTQSFQSGIPTTRTAATSRPTGRSSTMRCRSRSRSASTIASRSSSRSDRRSNAAINNPIAGCLTTSAAGFAGATYCSNTEPGKNFIKAEYLRRVERGPRREGHVLKPTRSAAAGPSRRASSRAPSPPRCSDDPGGAARPPGRRGAALARPGRAGPASRASPSR